LLRHWQAMRKIIILLQKSGNSKPLQQVHP
jgi:hypothetical protein